jgi:hypothetical protein
MLSVCGYILSARFHWVELKISLGGASKISATVDILYNFDQFVGHASQLILADNGNYFSSI